MKNLKGSLYLHPFFPKIFTDYPPLTTGYVGWLKEKGINKDTD